MSFQVFAHHSRIRWLFEQSFLMAQREFIKPSSISPQTFPYMYTFF